VSGLEGSMLEQLPGFPRARTLLSETRDPPSKSSVSARAGEPDVCFREAVDGSLAPIVAALERLDVADVTTIRRVPPRAGQHEEWPTSLDPRIRECWGVRGVARPYRHQRRALDALAAGRDLLLATATASGKSLCFQTPVLQAVLEDSGARAFFMFPTKALARDQIEGLRRLVGEGTALDGLIGAGVYDGDTPPDQRRAARAHAHVVASNPDMLHRAVLPHHDRWSAFLSGLRYIVVDELHTYRGLFGSHVANVLRRLLRLCAFYGTRPQIIACSATIANPRELAEGLTGRDDFAVIDESCAPVGPRTFVILNPKVVDPLTGVRRDFLKVTRKVSSLLAKARVPTLAFCRTRKAVELLTRYLREDEAGLEPGAVYEDGGAPMQPRPLHAGREAAAQSRVRGYRGGYLPEHRREIEAALRSGEAQIVVSTNALELGMDIGGLDAVVLAGYPGTRAATIQRSGRAGRRTEPALTIMVLSSAPLDQFIAADPGFLLDASPEHARVDPDNPEVLIPHLRCAAYELPFNIPGRASSDSYGPLAANELHAALNYLDESGVLHVEDSPVSPTGKVPGRVRRFFAVGSDYPAESIDLRGPHEENFVVVERPQEGMESGRILAEVDFLDAPSYIHVGAIYVLEGRCFEVLQLDWDARKAFVKAVQSQYYTEAVEKLRVRMIDPGDEGSPREDDGPSFRGIAATGYAHVVRAYPMFKKLRFRTHETVGSGPINLPNIELHTVAALWRIPHAALAQLGDARQRASVALAVGHAIHHVAAMVLMCDVSDLGHAVASGSDDAWAISPSSGAKALVEMALTATGRPTIYLYDQVAGGAGFAAHAHALGAEFLRRVLSVVQGCQCVGGCPVCVGMESLASLADPQAQDRGPCSGGVRDDATTVLESLIEAVIS